MMDAGSKTNAEVVSEDVVNVRVVTRLRPFNSREAHLSSKNIIQMSEKTVTMTDTEITDRWKEFQFDACHWSHDGFVVNESGVAIPDGPNSRFSDQEAIFKDIGMKMMDAAWQGKNATVVGYGITGSGKSYTLVGHPSDPGLLYRYCRHLFAEMERNPQNKYQVTVSMLEIYNEKVIDLLSKSIKPLQIRQKKQSFTKIFVQDLTVMPVKSASQTEQLLLQGLQNRSNAATNMNRVSSRSHLVITVYFQQFITGKQGTRTKRQSCIRFVDMAGSERSKRTGTTGAQLMEANAINMSITCLSSVIHSLGSQVDGKKTFVPYRNSKLTYLLCNDFGGNCETTIIASISPAAEDFDENLSTLRFLSRARKVIQKVVVNELDVDTALENWKAAIVEKETQLLSAESEQEKTGLEKAIETHQAYIRQLEAKWLEIESKEKGIPWWSTALQLQRGELETAPYLQNISEDILLSGVTKHSVVQGLILAGKSESDEVKIQLSGLGIQPLHAILENTGETLSIAPCSTRATVHVNGRRIHAPTELQHLDHIKLGACELFIVVGFPDKRAAGSASDAQHAYEKCLVELAENHPLAAKFKSAGVGNTRAETANLLLFQEFMHLLPQVAQAHAIAETFSKDVDFHVEVQQNDRSGLKLNIQVNDRKLMMEWLWSKGEFENRKLLMDELYGDFLLNGQTPQLSQNKNPFYDAKNLDICLGRCKVSVHNLAYFMPVDDEIRVFNSRGRPEGCVCICITPSPSEGEPPQEKTSGLKDPRELIGKELHLKCAFPAFSDVMWVAGNSRRGIYCKVTVIHGKVLTTETVFGVVSGKFERTFPLTIESVTQLELNQLVSRPLMLELWGTQIPVGQPTLKTEGLDVEEGEELELGDPREQGHERPLRARQCIFIHDDPSLASPSMLSPASHQPAQSESGKNTDPSLASPSMLSPASHQPAQSESGKNTDPSSASPSKLSPVRQQPAQSGSTSGSRMCTLM